MLKNTMGIILTEVSGSRLNELTEKRALAALPFGGRYRLIDFMLSNMSNSGIINVGIPTRSNYSSLMDHIGSGQPWDLSRKHYGVQILSPYRGTHYENNVDSGEVTLLYGIMDYLRKSDQEYVVIAQGNIVCNFNFENLMIQHLNTQADITMAVVEVEDKELVRNSHVIQLDGKNKITGVQIRPEFPSSNLISMNIALLKKDLFIRLLSTAYAEGKGGIIRDILVPNLNNLSVYGYLFDGYYGPVVDIQSFYEHNINVLKKDIRDRVFAGENRIYTKIKDSAPTKYGQDAKINNCIVADGCLIEGEIENSIISRGVHVGKGSVIRDCIIMQDSIISPNCELQSVIMDKEVLISEDKKLIGQENYPIIISKSAQI